MGSQLDKKIGACTGRWVRWSVTHPLAIIVSFVAVTALFLTYSVDQMGIDTDTAEMLSERLEWRQNFNEFRSAFPDRYKTILVLVDGQQRLAVVDAANQLRDAMDNDGKLFESVYRPGSGEFFDRNGLLYLKLEELEQLSDKLTTAQPLLGPLSADFTIGTFVETLERAIREGSEKNIASLSPVLDQIALAIDAVNTNQSYHVDWSKLLVDESTSDQLHREFLVVNPNLEFSRIQPAGAAIRQIRALSKEIDAVNQNAVRIRLTGAVSMEHEEMISASRGAGLAGLLALVAVTVVLWLAFGSLASLAAGIITLVCGLIATAAFATAAVGSLNLISVAFAVLYIGLGIDFVIHLTLRAQELVQKGTPITAALPEAASDVGSSLAIAATTTAAAFYSFIPTEFDGISELGLIAGTGMFISLSATLTLLPALLVVLPRSTKNAASLRTWTLERMLRPITSRGVAVIAIAVAVGIGSAFLLDKVRFDSNPINLRDAETESVKAYFELQAETNIGRATLKLLLPRSDAADMKSRLASLPLVEAVASLESLVPPDQEEKLLVLEDLDMALGPGLDAEIQARPPDPDRTERALQSLEAAISQSEATAGQIPSVTRLQRSLNNWLDDKPETDDFARVAALQSATLDELADLLGRFQLLLLAEPVDMSVLPAEIIGQWVSADGRELLEIFPREDITDEKASRRLIEQVRQIAPNVTGVPVVYIEAGDSIVRAFRIAFVYALIAVVIVLAVFLRNTASTILVLGPVLLAAAITGATAALFDLPFNFANIITLPLLLGIGVATTIHMVYRMRTAPPDGGSLLVTSTSQAVLFSGLTTLCSFGNMAFSPHAGMASMGTFLTIGLVATLLCTLILLPVLLERRYPQ